VTAHHRFLLKLHLDHIEGVEKTIETLDAELAHALAPFRGAVTRLCTIPGVSTVVAQTLVAEIGVEMHRFPTPGHLVSWTGLYPRLDESAGKRRSTRVRPGTPWLKPALVQAAWGCGSLSRRLSPRPISPVTQSPRPKKALVAVAASVLTAAYVILRDDGRLSRSRWRLHPAPRPLPHRARPDPSPRDARLQSRAGSHLTDDGFLCRNGHAGVRQQPCDAHDRLGPFEGQTDDPFAYAIGVLGTSAVNSGTAGVDSSAVCQRPSVRVDQAGL
jgi:hypothetical protein